MVKILKSNVYPDFGGNYINISRGDKNINENYTDEDELDGHMVRND